MRKEVIWIPVIALILSLIWWVYSQNTKLDRLQQQVSTLQQTQKPEQSKSTDLNHPVSQAITDVGQPKPKVSNLENPKLILIKKQNKAVFEMKDASGLQYSLYFYSSNAKQSVVTDTPWAGADVGDVLYTGDFKLAVYNKGTQKVTTLSKILKDYTYNRTRNMVYLIGSKSQGQPDILVVSTTEASSGDSADIFYIKNGKLVSIKTQTTDYGTFNGIAYSGRPKSIGNNLIQTMDYYNAGPVGYSIVTYSFDPIRGLLKQIRTKNYFDDNYDQGSSIYEQWKKDSEFAVN